jgi:O-acetyl-ADP-ribose deacetylase (regulator of RNase III)
MDPVNPGTAPGASPGLGGAFAAQLPYFLFVLSLFLIYGALVRRGVVSGRGVLWAGLGFGAVAVAASAINGIKQGLPPAFLAYNLFLMTGTAAFCVIFSYRQQRVIDLATFTAGDTKVIVRQAPATKLPDAQALLFPATTTLRMTGGIPGALGIAAGPTVEKEAMAQGPVGTEKVVETGPGKLPVGRLYHVAVNDPARPADAALLKRAMSKAALAAKNAGAESVVVPVGVYGGLSVAKMTQAVAEGVLRQRKAFAEVVFVVLEGRDADPAIEAVRAAVEAAVPGSTKEISKTDVPS